MRTLEIHLNDDLHAFILRQSRARGHDSAEAYIESLLAIERLRDRKTEVGAMLQKSEDGETQAVDDAYWSRLEADVFRNVSVASKS